MAAETTSVGRPRCSVEREQLEYLLDQEFTIRQTSLLLGVSERTIKRRLVDWNLSVRGRYSIATDEALICFLQPILSHNPLLGINSIHSRLRAAGLHVQRSRVRSIVWEIRSANGLACNSPIRRRSYSVPGSLCMWHIDGNHKLVRWKFVIHGGVDGYSRLIVFMDVSNNNRASTVMTLFTSAVAQWGLPFRVRSDKGYENADVALYMLQQRGIGRGSHITGKSVHNTRIERLWRDVFDQCTGPFYRLFWDLENNNALNPDSDEDLFSLHYVFMPLLKQQIRLFVDSWNRHKLRTEGNFTPIQLFITGYPEDARQNDLPVNEEIGDIGREDDGSSESEIDEPDLTNMPSVANPLNLLQHAELLLLFPTAEVTIANCRDVYVKVRDFVITKCLQLG